MGLSLRGNDGEIFEITHAQSGDFLSIAVRKEHGKLRLHFIGNNFRIDRKARRERFEKSDKEKVKLDNGR